MARGIGLFLLAAAIFLFNFTCFKDNGTEAKQADSVSGIDKKPSSLLKYGNSSEANLVKNSVILDSPKVSQGKDGNVTAEGLELESKKDSGNNGFEKELGLNQNQEVNKVKGIVRNESKSDVMNGNQGLANESLGVQTMQEKGTKNEATDVSMTARKENSLSEECDTSNRCVDDKIKLVACLRVPGNESPDLSLLIQNKGSSSLRVSIEAPKVVKLEQTTIQLREKEDKKVKVSIANASNETVIVLTAGDGKCELDFRDMAIPYSWSKVGDEKSSQAYYSGHLTPAAAICFFIVVLMCLAAAWACLTLYRRHDGGPRYQKSERELPISSGGRMERVTEGWDKSWVDTWGDDDDEETVRTSNPIANLSSKGLAPRRSNYKDGWKE